MSFSDDLLRWYDQCARSLPWRCGHDPYRIWLSEIMLQQTQAETVKRYYTRFLQRFPDVFALASAPEAEVLKLWEGLGYYSRARNLHSAARRIAFESGGMVPDTAAGLRALPGIGPYVSNAIASIAFGEAVPALDGNQARVLSRVLAWEETVRTPFDLLAPAAELISRERPGDYNQALMDLGATICTPRQPGCAGCPVAGHCTAFRAGTAEDFPRKPAPIPKREEDWSVLLVLSQGRLLVRRRDKGLLKGLWEFCTVERHPSPAELIDALSDLGFVHPMLVRPLPDSRHVFTHRIWRMKGWLAACDAAPEIFDAVDLDGLEALPFPSALRVYLEIARAVLSD